MKLQLKRSNVLDGGSAKEPTAPFVEYGELCVNYNVNDPALFIKDSNDNIIRIAGKNSVGSGSNPSGPNNPGTGNNVGDVFFNTGDLTLYYWDGSDWVPIASGDDNGFWSRNPDNGELYPAYLTDNVGIGTNNPKTKLHVQYSAVANAPSRNAALYLEQNGNCELQMVGNSANNIQLRMGTSNNSFKGALEYSLVNDSLNFYTSGSKKVTVLSNGNVGIGTDSPGTKLEVRATTPVILIKDGANNTAARYSLLRYAFDDGNGAEVYAFRASGAAASDAELGFRCGGSGSANDKMRIKANGNVGIGTTNPNLKLSVIGPRKAAFTDFPFCVDITSSENFAQGVGGGISFRGKHTANSTSDFGFIAGVKENATDGNYAGALILGSRAAGSGGVGHEKMRIASDGNVGIGTNDPKVKLQVNGDAALGNNNFLGFNAYYNSGWKQIGTGNSAVVKHNNSKGLQFHTAADSGGGADSVASLSPRITISDGGNVGIGTDSPADKLHVSGKIRSNSTASSDHGQTCVTKDYLSSAGSGGSGAFGYWTRSGTNLYNTNLGDNVGIGTNDPKVKLHVKSAAENESCRLENDRHTLRFKNVKTGTGTDWKAYQQVLEHVVDTATQEFIKFGSGNDSSTKRINLGTENDSNLMHLVSDKVGIGKDNPAVKLDINGKARSNSTVASDAGTTLVTKDYLSSAGSGGSGAFGYWTRSGTNLYNTNLGDNVGIGLSNPAEKLQVSGKIRSNSTASSDHGQTCVTKDYLTSEIDALDDVYVNIDGDTMTGDLTVPSLNGGQLAGCRNQLINGDFSIWQRSTSGIQNGYGADRWYTPSNNVQMNNDNARPFGLTKSIRMRNLSSSTTPLSIRQPVELPAAGLPGPFVPGSTWTMSYYITSDAITPECNLTFESGVTGGGSGNGMGRAAMELIETVDGQLGGGAAQTWYRYARTFTLPSTMVPSGADLCAVASFVIDNASVKDYRIAGCQLEPGPVATPFEHRPIGMELSLCQRYYQKIVVSGTVISSGSSSAFAQASFGLVTTMRDDPESSATAMRVSNKTGGSVTQRAIQSFIYANGTSSVLVRFDQESDTNNQYRVINAVQTSGGSSDLLQLDAEL